MALSITNIGSGSVVVTSTLSVRAPPGGTPTGAVIFCIIQDGAKAPGTMTDGAGNVYTNITSVTADSLFAWFCGNAANVKRSEYFTYAQNTINTGAQATFCYITGTPPTHFLDPLVTARVSGAFTTQPSLLTSGAPVAAGEAFIAASAAVFTGTSVGTYNQDTGRGWASPPNPITLIPAGGTQTFSLGPGSQVNVGSSALSYQPTFSLIPTTWGSFIVALAAAEVSQATFAGVGSLTVNTLPPFQLMAATFAGTGSLNVPATILHIQDGAVFAGTGSLNAAGFIPSFNGARFNGTGSLTANAIKAPSSGSLNGAGSLSAATFVARAARAVFAGVGSLAVQPSGLAGLVLFNGSGSLTATVSLAQRVSAIFNGTGSLSSIVSLRFTDSAVFNGVGNFSANSNKIAFGTIVFSGTGSLTLFVTFNVAAAATFNGAGSFSAAAGSTTSNSLTFSGAGSLSALASQSKAGFAQLNGSGSFAASVAFANVGGFATFNGAGNMTFVLFGAIFDSATFNGTGSLAATGEIGLQAMTSAFHGAGSLRVLQVFGAVNASAQFDGTGLLGALFNVLFTIPSFDGSGSLSADTFSVNILNTVNAGLGAVGEFPLGQEQSLAPLYASFAVFNGNGELTANLAPLNAIIRADFNGTGRMCVQAETWIGVAGQTTLEVCPGPGPTENVVA